MWLFLGLPEETCNFLTYHKGNSEFRVVAFTATQISEIENRKFPAELAGPDYPNGIPVYPEEEFPKLAKKLEADEIVFSYNDISQRCHAQSFYCSRLRVQVCSTRSKVHHAAFDEASDCSFAQFVQVRERAHR